MNIPRLHVTIDLADAALVPLDRDQTHYLASVMRRGPGDPVRLFNGRDGEWRAVVLEASRKAVMLQCETRLRAQVAVPDLELLFAPVKKTRTDFIVEKATELGARSIRPVKTAYTNAERVRLDRMVSIAREAAEQTERLDLPQIGEVEKLAAILAAWGDRPLIFCDEAGDAAPMLDALRHLSPSPSGEGRGGAALPAASILIGPEGGFSPQEREQIRALESAIPVTLGPRILRADTAAIAALTLWQAACGDWAGANKVA